MKPLGRRPSRFPGKVDHHPGKGWINWWEADDAYGSNSENKARDKREWQQQVKKELDDEDSDNSSS